MQNNALFGYPSSVSLTRLVTGYAFPTTEQVDGVPLTRCAHAYRQVTSLQLNSFFFIRNGILRVEIGQVAEVLEVPLLTATKA
jgi:hypothetical protein